MKKASKLSFCITVFSHVLAKIFAQRNFCFTVCLRQPNTHSCLCMSFYQRLLCPHLSSSSALIHHSPHKAQRRHREHEDNKTHILPKAIRPPLTYLFSQPDTCDLGAVVGQKSHVCLNLPATGLLKFTTSPLLYLHHHKTKTNEFTFIAQRLKWSLNNFFLFWSMLAVPLHRDKATVHNKSIIHVLSKKKYTQENHIFAHTLGVKQARIHLQWLE